MKALVILLTAVVILGEVGEVQGQEGNGVVQIGGLWNSWDPATRVAISDGFAYVATGETGVHIVDLSNPASPVEVGQISMPAYSSALDVIVSGRYCYIAGAWPGLLVYDVSDATQPVMLGSIDTPGVQTRLALSGTICYVADGGGGIRIIDVSDPAQMHEIGSIPTQDFVQDVAVNGALCVMCDHSGLRFYDVSDPTQPAEVGSYDIVGIVSVSVQDSYCYLANINGQGAESPNVTIVDISDVANPREVGRCNLQCNPRDAVASGDNCFVPGWEGGFRVIDIADPTQPHEVGSLGTPGQAEGCAINGNLCVVAARDGISVIGVLDAAQPSELARYTPTLQTGLIRDAVVSGTLCFVAAGPAGLKVVDISDPYSPRQLGSVQLQNSAWYIDYEEGFAYVGDLFAGLKIIDVRNPAQPEVVGGFYDVGRGPVYEVETMGNRCYFIDGDYLRILDISDPTNPRLLGSAEGIQYGMSLAIDGDYCYVTVEASHLLHVFDVSDPSQPHEVTTHRFNEVPNGLAVDGGFLYIANWSGSFQVIDVSDPAELLETGFLRLGEFANTVTKSGDYCYVTNNRAGVRVINVSDPTQPREVGYYDTPGLARGVATGLDGKLIVADYSSLLICDLVSFKRLSPMRQGWNIVSTYAPPPSSRISDVMEGIVSRNHLILAKDQSGRFYNPAVGENGFSNMEPWDVRQGYMAKLTEPDTLVIINVPVEPNEAIPLRQGWNIAAYYPDANLTAPQAFAGIVNVLDLAKDERGHFYRPATGFSNMGTLSRGKGYMVRARQATELVWGNGQGRRMMGDDDDENANANVDADVKLVHFVHSDATGRNMSVLVTPPPTPPASGGEWEVGVFTKDGLCVGSSSSSSSSSSPIGIAVWGDDPTTDAIDGAVEGEELGFRVWDGRAETPILLKAVETTVLPTVPPQGLCTLRQSVASGYRDPEAASQADERQAGRLSYATDGFVEVTLAVGAQGLAPLPSEYSLAEAYPNPFNGTTRISFGLPQDADVTVGIYDLSGRLVTELATGRVSAGMHSVTWNAEDVPSGLYLVKMRSGGFDASRKVVLAR